MIASLFYLGDLSHSDRRRDLVTDMTSKNRHRQLSRGGLAAQLTLSQNVRRRSLRRL